MGGKVPDHFQRRPAVEQNTEKDGARVTSGAQFSSALRLATQPRKTRRTAFVERLAFALLSQKNEKIELAAISFVLDFFTFTLTYTCAIPNKYSTIRRSYGSYIHFILL